MVAGFSAHAQSANTDNTPSAMTMTLGPTLGFGHSFTSNMNGNVFKPAPSLGIGAMWAKQNWGIGVKLEASHEGFKRQFEQNGVTMRHTIDPTYLRLTPTFNLFPGHFTTHVKPMIYVGPSIARKMAEDTYTSNVDIHEQDNQHFVIDNQFKEWDFGAVGGLGVSAQVGANTYLNVDASYYHGFFDVYQGNENRNVKVNLGLMFGL